MTLNPCELIRKKRFGEALSEAEIRAFVGGVTDGSFADYQTAAMLMAICINGMNDRETLALTMAMAHSGEMLELSDIPGVKADKHSTGGVSDSTSLILTPLVAACGVKMPMMSGRGLDFTGGTLDKLEAIPGLNTSLTTEALLRQTREIGCAIVGQTPTLAPADRELYALRDVTATVDCIPLIVASILSKKLAAGCDVVVLDVKVGQGALMDTDEKARELAETMVRIGNMSGRRFSALITDMNQPLGNAVGNALEVEEAIGVLSGKYEGDLKTVSLQLGARILRDTGLAASIGRGVSMLEEKIKNGEGKSKFAEMIAAQGGDPRVVEDPSRLPRAEKVIPVKTEASGRIMGMRASEIGVAARLLGAGRSRKTDILRPGVGVVMNKRIGDRVRRGEVLCTIYADAASDVIGAYNKLRNAIEIGENAPKPRTLIHAIVE